MQRVSQKCETVPRKRDRNNENGPKVNNKLALVKFGYMLETP